MTVVTSLHTFPEIGWWMQVAGAERVILDAGEHFQKMSNRNRYRISGANNPILLSVPLENGRNQRVAMAEVKIFNEERWQTQHWRTLVSVYKRSPFFDYYEPDLQPLYEQQFDTLVAYNKASIAWVMKQLKLAFELEIVESYLKDYGAGIEDCRGLKATDSPLPHYYQVFEERIGFLENLSILDLLFSEGPAAKSMLTK